VPKALARVTSSFEGRGDRLLRLRQSAAPAKVSAFRDLLVAAISPPAEPVAAALG
jgi:hypothetical protein